MIDVAFPEQTLESIAQNKLILDSRTSTEGILTISPEQVTQNLAPLAIGGTKLTSSFFDTSIIDGRIVMRGRRLVFVDEKQIVREANAAFRRIRDHLVVVRR